MTDKKFNLKSCDRWRPTKDVIKDSLIDMLFLIDPTTQEEIPVIIHTKDFSPLIDLVPARTDIEPLLERTFIDITITMPQTQPSQEAPEIYEPWIDTIHSDTHYTIKTDKHGNKLNQSEAITLLGTVQHIAWTTGDKYLASEFQRLEKLTQKIPLILEKSLFDINKANRRYT